jgi:type 1 glutamine amidotransferase
MRRRNEEMMRIRATILILFTLLLLGARPILSQQRVPDGARVLLLAGGQRSHHAYRRQAYLLQKLLEDTKQFEVTICEDAALLETPALSRYDLILATADRRDPEFRLTEAQQRAMLKFVHDGKGLFSLHAFCCADKTWVPEMRVMVGGVLAHFGTPDTRVRIGKYQIKITDSTHPIAAGVSDFEHEDELYYDLQTQGELKPIAAAVYEGKEWPIVWTRAYGSGRVCVNSFGHLGMNAKAADPLEDPLFQRLVLQGIAWVANRPPQKP